MSQSSTLLSTPLFIEYKFDNLFDNAWFSSIIFTVVFPISI